MKHLKLFNESDSHESVPTIKVSDLIEYLESIDPETEVEISSPYAKGETPRERLESSHWLHKRTDGIIVIDGLK